MKFLLPLFLFLFCSIDVAADPIWVIEPSDMMGTDEAILVLDAREGILKRRDKHAIPVKWQDFSQDGVNGGELLPDDELGKKLRKIGVRHDTPIVVFGDGHKGWGADGRIVWMLRALGHDRTYWVQGGLDGMKEAGWPAKVTFSSKPGDFVPVLDPDLIASTADVQAAIKNDVALIDTREPREFKGKTPYGETRGGHVPTAIPLHFKALFDASGRVKSAGEVADLLILDGVEKETPLLAYCTGGVRSAMFVVILRHLGFNAKNYAGSMWQWAALPAASHPLMKSRTQKKK